MDALSKRTVAPSVRLALPVAGCSSAAFWKGVVLAGIVALSGGVVLVGCAPGRTLEAVHLLRDIEAGDGPSTLKRITPEPLRTAVTFTVEGRERSADLYSPSTVVRAGLVLVPGLTPNGRDDPRLVAFARSLTRAQFEVVVPDLPRMRSFQVSADDAEPIADSVRWLDERVDGRPLGLSAVSFAVGPAAISLDDPQAAGRVDFFLGIGGYYDLEALITYVTTGFYRTADKDWTYRPAKGYARWVFLLTNAGRLGDAGDRAVLFDVASRKLDDPDADVDRLTATLGPDGEAVYALIANSDPQRVPALIAALPPEIRTEIERLDLSRRQLDHLSTSFILIHDRHDRTIPAEESVALARAISPDRARLYLIGGLDHAQVNNIDTIDVLALLDAISAVLRIRDGADPSS